VQMEINDVRRRQRQWLRWRGRGSDLVGGSAGRVCQGESSGNAPVWREIVLAQSSRRGAPNASALARRAVSPD
jgi:hypothetical protein